MSHFTNLISIINRTARQRQLSSIVRNTDFIRKSLQKFVALGYIRGFTFEGVANLRIYMKYDSSNNSTLKSAYCISKPGKRVYVGYKKFDTLNTLVNNLNISGGTILISTSTGIRTHKEALALRVGGEVLCVIK